MFKVIYTKIQDYFKYRKAVEELNAFTDRELMDIGINRADIPFIVAESMKG